MKRKQRDIPPITDWNITNRNRQGDYFDRAIKSWIDGGLDKYPSDHIMSNDALKVSFAHSFFDKAERLLKEHAPHFDDQIKMIEDLRTIVSNVEFQEVFLMTLYVVTATYKAGTIPEMVKIGETHSNTQSIKGSKERTRDGMTPEERKIRNQKMIKQFQQKTLNSHLSMAGFAQKYAAIYGLKSRQAREILKNAVGS